MIAAPAFAALLATGLVGTGEREPACSEPSVAPRVAERKCDGRCPPPYPPSAVRRRITGEVLLKLTLSESGSVTSASVARSSGNRVLDEAAVSAARAWRLPGSSLPPKPDCDRTPVPPKHDLAAR
jgi:TonB family protein